MLANSPFPTTNTTATPKSVILDSQFFWSPSIVMISLRDYKAKIPTKLIYPLFQARQKVSLFSFILQNLKINYFILTN